MKNITRNIFLPANSSERFITFAGVPKFVWPHFDILMAGLSNIAPGYLVERVSPPFHLLLLVREGEISGEDAAGSFSCPAPRLLFLPAGNSCRYLAERPAKIIWYHLDATASRWAFLAGRKRFCRQFGDAGLLEQLLEKIYQENSATGTGDPEILNSACRLTLRLVEQAIHGVLDPDDERRRRIRTVFDAVEAAPAHPWDIGELARRSGFSVPHFHTLVRKFYGRSPGTVLAEIRLFTAAGMLRATDYKLELIAAKCGFGCAFSLSRAFRRFYGVPPRKYRTDNPVSTGEDDRTG